MKFTINEKITELHRELAYRKKVYERLIGRGLMSRDEANRRYALMRSLLNDYQRIIKSEKQKLEQEKIERK